MSSVKTKAWTRETTSSRQNNAICLKNEGVKVNIEEARIRSKWPAVMLAVSRTLRVMGRIKFLNLSIKTMNEIK